MKKSRWLGTLLAAVMACALWPTTALAQGTACPDGDACTAHDAAIGNVHYDTLAQAMQVGGTVRLLRDVQVDSVITVTQPTVLELGNHTVTNLVESGRAFRVEASAFTVNAGSGGMVIQIGRASCRERVYVLV